MDILQHVLAMILAVTLIGALGRRVPIPLPLLLVGGGVAMSAISGFEKVELEPEIFFALFIPPLLFADSWLLPKREFYQLRYSIMLLAFGLVFATVFAVGYGLHLLIPSLPLAACFALGAVVSPTDAVAVSALTEKVRLPSRSANVLAGESLVNDASGLVAFKFAVAAVLTGSFSLEHAAVSFVALTVGGLLAGLAVSGLIQWLRRSLVRRGLRDPSVSVALSLLTPFAAYLVGEQLFHFSGILAVVAAGFYAGVHDSKHMETDIRLHAWSVWTMLLFVFNGLVFLLLGLQLRSVFIGISGYSGLELLYYALAVSGMVIVVRLLWIFPFSRVSTWLMRLHDPEVPTPPWRNVFITGWAGIRGAVTLAGALSIPLMAGEAPFPGRNLLILLATSVIIATLLINGLTLPLFIRLFRVQADDIAERETRAARVATTEAAIKSLANMPTDELPEEQRFFLLRLMEEYEHRRLHYAYPDTAQGQMAGSRLECESSIRLKALAAERTELHRLRQAGIINDETLRTIQFDIDYVEASLTGRV
ncbi:MAG: Na+/H+ antiporter [Gammaproteobacteria bacterium]|nr:Na+/H+ antiporter [Gammaproteobacteria bacterium]